MADHQYTPDVARGLCAPDGSPDRTGRLACRTCGNIGADHTMAPCDWYSPADMGGSPCVTCGRSRSDHRPSNLERAIATHRLAPKDYTRAI